MRHFLIFSALCAASLGAGRAQAASYVVTTTADPATTDGVCSVAGSGDGCTFREAVTAANAGLAPSPSEVSFAAGVSGSISLTRALPDISGFVNITGPGPDNLTVQRSTDPGTPPFHIFNLKVPSGIGPKVSFNGLTIANGSDSAYGGGILNTNCRLTVSNCAFAGNYAEQGGSIAELGDFPTLALSDSTFRNNSAVNAGGVLVGGSTISITRCTFDQNHVTGRGGAIFTLDIDSLPITNCTFTGNTAGGTAGFGGGAFYIGFGTVNLDSCTLTGNSATDTGGAISNSTLYPARLHIRNSIIAGNTAATGPNINGAVSSDGYNLIGTVSGSTGLPGTADQINVANAKLGPLSLNGGLTPTVALLTGSPALDAGSTTLTVDQRNTMRPRGSAADIGAFEADADAILPSVSIGSPTADQSITIPLFTAASGAAADNVGVTGVQVKLLRSRGGLIEYWNGTSFGGLPVLFPATLATPGAPSTTWNFPVPAELRAKLDVGPYTLVAYARDAAGNQSPAIGKTFNLKKDSDAPYPTVNFPTSGQTLSFANFTNLNGSVSDNVGTTEVTVKIFRVRNGVISYWNGTSFGTNPVLFPTTVATPGNVLPAAVVNTWSFQVSPQLRAALDTGAYTAVVYAKDAAGNQSIGVGQNFNLYTEVVAPSVTISSPAQNQILPISSFNTATGTASDNVGVTEVLVKIFRQRDGVNQFWNGTSFTPTTVLFSATVASPGALTTKWTYSVPPELKAALDAGTYTLVAYGKDAAGNISPANGHNFTLTASGAAT